MTTVRVKLLRVGDVQTRQGRMGEYQTQGIMVQPEGAERQSLYGTLFGQSIDVFRLTGARSGDTIEVGLVFTTAERNGFVSNYIEIVNPRKL